MPKRRRTKLKWSGIVALVVLLSAGLMVIGFLLLRLMAGTELVALQTAATIVGSIATMIAAVLAFLAALASRDSAEQSASSARDSAEATEKLKLVTDKAFSRSNVYVKRFEIELFERAINGLLRDRADLERQMVQNPTDATHIDVERQNRMQALNDLIAEYESYLSALRSRNAAPESEKLTDADFD